MLTQKEIKLYIKEMENDIEEIIKIAQENVKVDDDIINARLRGACEMKYIMKKKLKGLG